MSPPSPGPTPGVGTQIGPYVIEEQIGSGGMGALFSASDVRLDRRVALKVLLGHHAQDPQFRQRFQREAAVLARLDHPHVISIFDHGEHDGWPYLVTQYAPGGDLGALLRQRGPMPPPLAAQVCAQVSDALHAAHEVGVVHRDVKPPNVLIRDARLDRLDRIHVYLGDFGVAHDASTGLTTAGAVAGTWNYLAPERAEGTVGGPATDIYAVGCLLWETLTGTPPYSGSDVEVAMAHLQAPLPQLPGEDGYTQRINHVLARAMAKDPTQRPQTARQLRDEIRALAPRTAESSFTGGGGRGRRRRLGVRIGVAAAAVLLASAGTAYWMSRGASDGDPQPPVTETTQVTGDLDGDGLGDVGFVDKENKVIHLWSSSGDGFGEGRTQESPDGQALVAGITGDDTVNLVDVAGTRGTVAVTIQSGDERTRAAAQTPGSGFRGAVLAGDFDGDGRDDLALAGWGDGTLSINVARSKRNGGLSNSRTWFSASGNDESLSLASGDFDGNGTDELVLASVRDGEPRLTVLRREGSEFRADGESTPAPKLSENSGSFRTADLDGDDTDELLFVGSRDGLVTWRFDDGFEVDDGFTLGGTKPEETSISDVDGDGLDDLVAWNGEFEDLQDAQVFRSEGDRFESPERWLDDLGIKGFGSALDRATEHDWSHY